MAVPATTAGAGGKEEEEGDSESWDMYLRTAEDQEKIKIEWESENKDWIESQVPVYRVCGGVLCTYTQQHISDLTYYYFNFTRMDPPSGESVEICSQTTDIQHAFSVEHP